MRRGPEAFAESMIWTTTLEASYSSQKSALSDVLMFNGQIGTIELSDHSIQLKLSMCEAESDIQK